MAKGGEFEILVSRKFTKWITGSEKPEVLWRSVSLGPKATIDRRRGGTIRKIGDLVAIHPKGEWLENTFLIECKHHHSIDFMDLFKSKSLLNKSNVYNWIVKYHEEAVLSKKKLLLIFRANNQPVMIALESSLLSTVDIFFTSITYKKATPGTLPHIIILPFDELLNGISYVSFRQEVRNIINK